MSSRKVTAINFFSGWLVGGMDPQEWERLPPRDQITATMEYLADRAQWLAEMPHDPESGIPATVHSRANALLNATQAALTALDQDNMPQAMYAAFNAGAAVEKVTSVQITATALSKLQSEFENKSTNGKISAKKRYAKDHKRIIEKWRYYEDNGTAVHGRITYMVETLGISRDTIADHLHREGLKPRKPRKTKK